MYLKLEKPLDPHLIVTESPFGSCTYGRILVNDIDLVCIIKKSTGEFIFQHKEGRFDRVYVDWYNFINIMRIGGNQNFFETIHTKDFQKSYHDFPVDEFYTPIQARGYIGLAHRDLKPQFFDKRIFHINRCLWIAEKILKKQLIILSEIDSIPIEQDHKILTERMTALRNQVKGIHDIS